MTWKRRTWEILEPAKAGDRWSRFFDIALIGLISLNIIAVVLGSVQTVSERYGWLLEAFEVFSITAFAVEYLGRIWSCTEDHRFSSPVVGRLRFASRPMSIIDLLAILPFYLPFLYLDLRVARALRLFRLVRVFKLGRYSRAFAMLGSVVTSKKEELVVSILALFILMVISATLMFFAEHEAQPEAFSSIPATLWWAVVTLTTVGYGDIYPVTVIGKVIAGVFAILGVGMVALPAGIISSGFFDQIKKSKQSVCPHCGEPLDG